MSGVSPPKPWERGVAAGNTGVVSQTSTSAISAPAPMSSATTTATLSSNPPALPDRPSSLSSTINRNASAYSPYNASRFGTGMSPYGSTYGSPYSRMGYGSGGMYGSGYGGMGYGGMGGMGGIGGMYGGMGGMGGMGPMDPNDPNSLTNGFTQSTQATFQIIESIVGAFGGFAQMLESTYMATHSSFFAMVSVAEQFGNLRNTLGSILGIFTLLRWLRTLFAKVTGRPPPADATSLTPSAFARFEGRKLLSDGTAQPSQPKPSKKPFLFFIAAAFGLPYLMGKLIRTMAASQEEEERRRLAMNNQTIGPNGEIVSTLDPSKLEFCRVLYDFAPQEGAAVQGVDLAVKKGDLVAVLSKSDPMGNASEWWRCRSRDGRVGYLPGVYLEPAARQTAPVKQIASKSQSGSRTSTMTSEIASANLGATKEKEKVPIVSGKAGDIGVESFQKSQFYS